MQRSPTLQIPRVSIAMFDRESLSPRAGERTIAVQTGLLLCVYVSMSFDRTAASEVQRLLG